MKCYSVELTQVPGYHEVDSSGFDPSVGADGRHGGGRDHRHLVVPKQHFKLSAVETRWHRRALNWFCLEMIRIFAQK